MVFRRRRRADSDLPAELDGHADDLADDPAGSAGAGEGVEPVRPDGPWDADDAPADELTRLDLGGLRVPVLDGMEVRVEVSPEQQVVAATLIMGSGALQINAFAAPRREGIWAEVLEEIATSLRAGGGSAESATGPFGLELRARVPAEVPGQGVGPQPARFVGVDGPRWFLRGLFTGAASTDPVQAAALEEAFRNVVVVRGNEAMAPRDPLPLRLPQEALDAAAAAPDGPDGPNGPDGPDGRGGIDPFERGPEITEVR